MEHGSSYFVIPWMVHLGLDGSDSYGEVGKAVSSNGLQHATNLLVLGSTCINV